MFGKEQRISVSSISISRVRFSRLFYKFHLETSLMLIKPDSFSNKFDDFFKVSFTLRKPEKATLFYLYDFQFLQRADLCIKNFNLDFR